MPFNRLFWLFRRMNFTPVREAVVSSPFVGSFVRAKIWIRLKPTVNQVSSVRLRAVTRPANLVHFRSIVTNLHALLFQKKQKNINKLKKTACREAYNDSETQYACNLGCQNQLPFAVQRQEQVCNVSLQIVDYWEEKKSILSICFFSSWTPWCQRFTCCTPWLWSEGYGRMWWARPTAWSLPLGHSTSKPTMARLWFSRYARKKLLPCPTAVHWTFVSVLSSVYQTEPQIKFFTPFELEKDAEEDPQKSCKPPSFFCFFLSLQMWLFIGWLTVASY